MEYLKDIILAVMVKSAADELNNLLTKIAAHIIYKALKYVPSDSRERYEEEWTAHLNDCPSGLRKIGHAIGCFYAARRIDPMLPLLARIYVYVLSIFLFFLAPLIHQMGWYYLAKAKLCLLSSKFMKRIGARTQSQRLRRAGLSLARTSFLLLDLHLSFSLFLRTPQHCQLSSSLGYLYYKLYTASNIILTLRSFRQRFALGKKPAKIEKQSLPECLRLAGEVGMLPTKRLRIKRHRRIR
jgi:hypothetical protein